jgi:hypothetical protein
MLQALGGGTIPFLIIYLGVSAGATYKWHFFPRLLGGGPKTRTFIVPKLWLFISSSNQTYLDHVNELFYSPEKNIPRVYNTPQSKPI